MSAATRKPRVGFLGVGWIGRHRLEAIRDSGAVDIVACCDPSPAMTTEALRLAPGAVAADSLDAMLDLGLDGVVIASPSALHAEQSIRALAAGAAVFCQKPLGRSAAEARAVVDAARVADGLLGVDLSYRRTAAMEQIARLLREGRLGRVFAADLVFHNAYGPDKPWFRDRAQSGGGCVIDLGVHLVDLALWALGFPEVVDVRAELYAGGAPLPRGAAAVEDYAVATLVLAGGAIVRLACSWHLHAGQDAVILASFHGSDGGAALRNVGGSFYDFAGDFYRGTDREWLTIPPDDWSGRAAVAWAHRLAAGDGFDPAAEQFVTVATVLDRIYAAANSRGSA